jgi:hypothetical protein
MNAYLDDRELRDEADIYIAAQSSCAVLITALPDDALEIARAIATERGCADRLLVCDFGAGAASRAAELASLEQTPRILLLREVHDLTPRQQELLMELLEEGHGGRGPRIFASSSVSLFDRVQVGAFDARLFYRLNTVHVVANDDEMVPSVAVM